MIHPSALCETKLIGEGTRVWAFAHIMDGAVIGRNCNIGDGVFIESGAVIGNDVTVKNQAMVWDGVLIEDEVFIGPGVIFTNDNAPRSPRMALVADRYANPKSWRAPTVVRRGAAIGAGAVLLPNIVIGRYAMIAAGAVVTSDVEAHRLVAGNPARPIGWVCACGGRIDESQHCPLCGLKFIRPVPDDSQPSNH
jgi:acetyltransferase-like isoleucine patch superfamily enzyme